MALTVPVVVFVSDSFISDPEPLFAAFDIPATAARDQAKVHPAVPLVIVYASGVVLQTVFVAALLIVATGLRLVVVDCDAELQVGAVTY